MRLLFSPLRPRRDLLRCVVALPLLGLLQACGEDSDDPPTKATDPRRIYVGEIEGLNGLVAFDVDDPAATTSGVRVYACTGTLESTGGFALWFKGTMAEGASGLMAVGSATSAKFSLNGNTLQGTLTLADGRSGALQATEKSDGSGIYDITVGSDRSYSGKSTRGEQLNGEISQATDGSLAFQGTITLLDGSKVPVAGVADKEDTYIAVGLVEGGKLRQAGRSGDVRAGKPGLNVIDGTSNT